MQIVDQLHISVLLAVSEGKYLRFLNSSIDAENVKSLGGALCGVTALPVNGM